MLENLPFNPYRSEAVDKVFGALSKAQGTYKKPQLDMKSIRGHYSSLSAILDSTREALDANGLSFTQNTYLLDEGSGAKLLISTLGHESGQYLGSCERVVIGKTKRRTGNLLETDKRLQASMLLGVAPSYCDPFAFDDDGQEVDDEEAAESVRRGKIKIEDPTDTINTTQYNELCSELEGYPELAENIIESYNIDSLSDLPREEYHKACARIRKIKKAQDEYNQRKNT